MSKSITPAKIHATAERLQAAGTQPTLAAVRQALGGGSFTTISEAMKTWRAQQPEQTPVASDAPPAVLAQKMKDVQTTVWDLARQKADQRYQAEREALDKQRGAIQAQLKEMRELVEVLEAEGEAAQARQAELEKENQALKEMLQTTQEKKDSLGRQLAQAEVYELQLEKEQIQRAALEKELLVLAGK